MTDVALFLMLNRMMEGLVQAEISTEPTMDLQIGHYEHVKTLRYLH